MRHGLLFTTYHKGAVNSKRKFVKIDDTHFGKERRRLFTNVYVWIKSFLTQVMRREINKGYETFVSFTFLEVNLTLFLPKCFFQKNKSKKIKTVSNGVFSSAAYVLKKKSIQQLAIEKRPIMVSKV